MQTGNHATAMYKGEFSNIDSNQLLACGSKTRETREAREAPPFPTGPPEPAKFPSCPTGPRAGAPARPPW